MEATQAKPLRLRRRPRVHWASAPFRVQTLLCHAAALIMLALAAGMRLCRAQAVDVPYPDQLLQSAADSCQFGLYATGSSGAIMQAHEGIAESTYTSLSLEYQLPIVSAVMQAIGCATESVDGFAHPFKTTLVEGEAFPKPFFIPKLGDLPSGTPSLMLPNCTPSRL